MTSIEASSHYLRGGVRGYHCPQPHISNYFQYKSFFDRTIAALLLIPAFPVICLLILIVRLTSKGPGIYSQERLGKNGKIFTMYKIRSMGIDAEKETGAVWAAKNDTRVTTIGRILRKFHLDELPQLFNVLKGEMALVGPRPEREDFVKLLNEKVDGYSYRMLVVPGVTGFAQLNLPPDIEVDDVKRKIALDFEYIENASFWFDFVLILGTLGRFAKFLGHLHLHLLGIHRNVEDCPWAIYVGAINTTPKEKSVDLSQLFEMATTERNESTDSR